MLEAEYIFLIWINFTYIKGSNYVLSEWHRQGPHQMSRAGHWSATLRPHSMGFRNYPSRKSQISPQMGRCHFFSLFRVDVAILTFFKKDLVAILKWHLYVHVEFLERVDVFSILSIFPYAFGCANEGNLDI